MLLKIGEEILLYIHIPFCDSKCGYCSFNSYVKESKDYKDYMSALEKQLIFELERFKIGRNEIESVYIGGGTPSIVPPKLYIPIFENIFKLLKIDAEITVEANPNSATQYWLEYMFNLGVNRVSFGVQSFRDEKLKGLGRTHSSQDAINAVKNAEKVGFKNISIDIIYDYKSDTEERLKRDIDLSFELPINHISAYELTIESGTKFYNRPYNFKQNNEDLGFFITDEITKRGFKQYEVSNFGLYKSRHNIGYWRLKDYMGVGAGAVGFKKNKRFYPYRNISKYVKNPLYSHEEVLTNKDILNEKIFLGLRSLVGIKKSILNKNMKDKGDFLVTKGKLRMKNETYYNDDFFISDELALFIMG